MSYNNWLREEAVDSKNTLVKSMARLQVRLQVLESVILQEGITLERYARLSTAMEHLVIEVDLSVILTEAK